MRSERKSDSGEKAKITGALLRDPGHFLALGLGSGLLPRAPGTWGSLAAIPLYYLLALLPAPAYLAVLALSFLLGIWLCGRAARAMGVHDHGSIVWDEFVGVWITLAGQPLNIGWVLLGVLLFRLFDIIKPWPIQWLDRRVAGGLGIMLDDGVAGLVALLLLSLFRRYFNLP